MAVFRSAREELEKAYPELYEVFRNIPGRKAYVDITVGHKAGAAILLERYGASVFSAKPPITAFHYLAAAREEGLVLISAGKGLSDVQQIVGKCGLGHNMASDITAI